MLLSDGDLKPENQEQFHQLLLELRDFLRTELDKPNCGYKTLFRALAMANKAEKKLKRIINNEHLIIGGKRDE